MKLKYIFSITSLHQKEEIQHVTKEIKALKKINALNQHQPDTTETNRFTLHTNKTRITKEKNLTQLHQQPTHHTSKPPNKR